MASPARSNPRKKRTRPEVWRLRRHEQVYRTRGVRLLAGVDEAGVGPLAGPVVAAAVIMPEDSVIRGVNDSKQVLRAADRERLAAEVVDQAVAVAVGLARPREIERINIYHATLQAMARAVKRLRPAPELVLVDARTIPGLDMPQEAHVGGDATFYQIACASLVAKTFRDALMRRMDLRYPGYGFARHMGYPTPAHREALRQLGPCWIHRRNTSWVMEHAQGDLKALWAPPGGGEAG